MPRGFDFHKRKSFQGWGARREWPPLNPRQEVEMADTALPAGTYYLAIASDSTTATFFAAATNGTTFESIQMAALKLSTFALPSSASAATRWEGPSASAPDFVSAFGF